MSHFDKEPPKLEPTQIDWVAPKTNFIPEPWMISAYYDEPDRLSAGLKRELKTYIDRHPLIAKARKLTESRRLAQDDAIRRFVRSTTGC